MDAVKRDSIILMHHKLKNPKQRRGMKVNRKNQRAITKTFSC